MGEPAVKAAAVQKPGWSDELVRDAQARLDKRRREQAVAADDKGKGKKSKGKPAKGDKDVAKDKHWKPMPKAKPMPKPWRVGIRVGVLGVKRDADSMAADDKGMGKGNKSKSSHDEDITEVTDEDLRSYGIYVEEDSDHDQDQKEVEIPLKCAHPHCLKFAHPEQAHGFCCKRCRNRFDWYPDKKAKEHGIHCTGDRQSKHHPGFDQ